MKVVENAEEPEEFVEVAREDTSEGAVVDVDDKGKGYTEWIVNLHDRPPDGGGGAPDLRHEGNVGEGPGCGGHDVILDLTVSRVSRVMRNAAVAYMMNHQVPMVE